ncbi:hypothetical protein L227DRAFT_617796 [Lentinus tigrinus ALCF2SS1-6]|uniref:HAM1-like N-terminal domain-containing protein n=1 Tax=Lentinus tigrinus ALCF2SS1-6 TaxID=1328759 RepID=A0A5C2RMC1_9APHY|nr:hypothetical protein L227DRAFT_617796 [Lentinus tigrinus ALCF2SS1-6]
MRGDEVVHEAQHEKDEFNAQAQPGATLRAFASAQLSMSQPFRRRGLRAWVSPSAQDKISGVKDSNMGHVADEHKHRANKHAAREGCFLSERRHQFIFRLKKVIYECQSYGDYQGSTRWLLNFLEEYASHGRTIAGHGKDSHQQLASDPNLKTSLNEIRTLFERFANARSLDTNGDAMCALYEDGSARTVGTFPGSRRTSCSTAMATSSSSRADTRGVPFYFPKETGTRKLTNCGVADVLLCGSGLTLTAHLEAAGSSMFKAKDVATSVDMLKLLKLAMRDSKHDMLH